MNSTIEESCATSGRRLESFASGVLQFATRKNHKLQLENELFTLERATAQA